MKDRKLSIAEFIETLETERLSSSILLGGANKNGEGTNSASNGTCKNGDPSCSDSTNNTQCDNALNMCSKTKNKAICDNTWQPAPANARSCDGSSNAVCG